MNKIFSKKQDETLRKMNIGLVYLFGSEVEGASGPLSDIDIGVVFKDKNIVYSDTRAVYNQLYNLFAEVFKNKDVDIVLLERAGLELKFDVISHGKIIFEASQEFRFSFEEKVNNFYLDFKPILEEFNQAILKR